MSGLKGIMAVVVMVAVGVVFFLILASVKIFLLMLRYFNRRVLDQF